MGSIHLDLLDAIERQEMLSLTWGYVDGSMSRKEAIKLGLALVNNIDESEDLLEELIELRLVFELKGERVRSRFAELIRLLSRLRQLFPGKPWRGGNRLVSDFRVDLRRRIYPRRDRSPISMASEHSSVLAKTPLRKSVWTVLAEKNNLPLAAFQERATLRLLTADPDSGTIITAGTGSGKTLAFYYPALMLIADLILPKQYWVKALAIYPRTELLKDQLAEMLKRTRAIEGALIEHKRRPMLLGALFFSTPNNASAKAIADKKWSRRGESFVCPWIVCPICSSEMIWRDSDIADKKECLVCASAECRLTVNEDQLVLTRSRLLVAPPDILFTTTEMINQRMSDLSMQGLFGIGKIPEHRPVFLLLDEVHTYIGTSGAQAALTLRRWRYLVDAPVVWCGLSATLNEAPRFFSDLTGLSPSRVTEVTPNTDELIAEGAEYQVILRGDVTLQASLLSTSIQATMLIARMMDPGVGSRSKGKFGRRLFVFADDLDVTNRFFDNLKDAEAYTIFGRADGTRNPLAALRGNEPYDPERDVDGQRWWASERIGRVLNTRLVIGRTTAQDSGVLSDSDVIVATSALEVGYSDDQVGAVLQHKSPRSMASFLQRKGRAGRVRGMRPFTVTALSDYGRDRVSFQAYEHLFDPALPAQFLPIHNQYVLRMQSVFSFIEWLSRDLERSDVSGWLWELLSKPESRVPTLIADHVKNKLTRLLRGDASLVSSLQGHLERSLQLPTDTVSSLLWEPPRSLLIEVVPTLVRRLFLDWKLAFPVEGKLLDFQVDYHPLPDFIPRNLFGDLSLPEVQVMLPPATKNDVGRQEALPIVQALQQLAPGRVNRRFAFERGGLCHWVGIDIDVDKQTMSIDKFAEHNEALGIYEGCRDNSIEISMRVFRPWVIRLSMSPREVLPTSNAFLVWYSGFLARGTPLVIGVPPRSLWFEYVSDVHFYLHRFRASIAVRRFSPEVFANIRQSTGEKLSTINFVDPFGQPAAIGFEIEVDGFHIDFRLPSVEELLGLPLPAELFASNRLSYHRHRFNTYPGLPQEVNALQRDWLHQILVSASVARALLENVSVGEAAKLLLADSPERAFGDVMRSLFVLKNVEDELEAGEDFDTEKNTDQPASFASRLEERLKTSLSHMEVIECLRVLASEFDAPEPKAYGAWLRQTLHETLADALLQACINTAPRHAATDTLVSDYQTNAESGLGRVWISETTPGGAGVIQAFADAFSSEPRALFRALEAALAPTDLELTSHGLKQFLTLTCGNPEIAKITEKIRATVEHQDRNILREQLYQLLAQNGVDVSHALSVSINTRLLRPGSGKEWDLLLLELLNSWEEIESRFSLSIGLREFSYIALKLPGIRERVKRLIDTTQASFLGDAGLIQVLNGLLWPRGIEIRQRALQSYNPFRTKHVSDPALVRALLLATNIPVVSINDTDWLLAFTKHLADHGVVQLKANRSEERNLRSVITGVLGRPIDVGYLQFFPVVERMERTETETKVSLSLREQV